MLFLKIILTVAVIDLKVPNVNLTESMFDLMGVDFQE